MRLRGFLYSCAGILAALALGAAGFALTPQTTSSAQSATAATASAVLPATTTPDVYPVVRVIDGDTLVVMMDGSTTTIRVLGLDTPETVDPRKPVQCFGKEASDEAKKLLTGQYVRLEADASQGALDIYGRTLAYVHLLNGTFYDEYMIAEGYGHEYTFKTPYKYQAEFKAAQAKAKEQQLGLWSPSTCGGNTTQAARTAS